MPNTINNGKATALYNLFKQANTDVAKPTLWHLIIGIGQSRMFGTGGKGLKTVADAAYGNRMFVDGERAGGGSREYHIPSAPLLSSLVPLQVLDESGNSAGHTIGVGLADQWAKLCDDNGYELPNVIWATAAWAGKAYVDLEKGASFNFTHPTEGSMTADVYQDALNIVTAAKAFAGNDADLEVHFACIHGASDHVIGTTQAQYEADLLDWITDFTTDAVAITGQTRDPILFLSQFNVNGYDATDDYDGTGVDITLAQLEAHKDNSNIVMVGPEYILPFRYVIPGTEGIHYFHVGTRWLGHYFGKAMYQRLTLNTAYEPLRPSLIERSGTTITITYTGRVGNLQLDTTYVDNMPDGNYGFTYDGATITGVSVNGSNQIEITIDGDAGGTLTYGLVSNAGVAPAGYGGPEYGARGNVCDTNTTVAKYNFQNIDNRITMSMPWYGYINSAYDLRNWSVAFSEVVA